MVWTVHDWGALEMIAKTSDIGFFEGYHAGLWDADDIPGLLVFFLINETAMTDYLFSKGIIRVVNWLRHLFRPNTRRGSRRNIIAHYDLGNDFYQHWLDGSMTYSAGLYTQPDMTLESAQNAKYQAILDDLNLPTGSHILEIGCGWGGFAIYAAHQGYHITAITISPAQHAFAQERIEAQKLEDRITLQSCDYRELEGQYDGIVSIEMFEAVGKAYWGKFFQTVKRCLKPNRSAIIQTITIAEENFQSYIRNVDFIQLYIFPGGLLPSPERFCRAALNEGLKVENRRSFGPSYTQTLEQWRARFQLSWPKIMKLGFDESFYRLWDYYLSYCIAGFRTERIDVVHFQLTR